MFGFQGYSEDAGAINSELERYRADKDNIIGMNSQLKEQAEQLFTTKNIENVVENFGIVGAVKGLHSYGTKAYNYKFNDKYAEKFGGRSLKDLDQKLGKKMGLTYKRKLKAKTKGGEAKEGAEENEDVEAEPEPEDGGEVERGASEVERSEGAAGEEDNLSSFIQRMRNRITPQPEPEEEQSFREPAEGKYDEEGAGGAEEVGEADQEDIRMALDENVSVEEYQDHLDSKYNFSEEGGYNFSEAAENVVGDVGGQLGELGGSAAQAASGAAGAAGDIAAGAAGDLAAAAGDIASGAAGAASEALAGGIESIATAMDATGVLAPIGFLLNIGGLFAAGFGAYEAAETIGKEIAGPTDKDIPQVALPDKPKTMAEKGILVTPHFNSLDTYGSVSTSW